MKKLSLVCAIIICISILWSYKSLPRFKYSGFTQEITYDAVSYYLYLPMWKAGDPGMKTPLVDSLFAKYKFSPTLYQIHDTENKTRVPNYTIGMSYFFLPGYLMGDFWARHSGYPPDGFSYPYHVMISISLFLIILPGIFILRKFLLNWFSDGVVAATLFLLFMGTSYFCEAISNHLQPHCMLFTLYTILLYHTKKWHDSPNFSSAAIMGFVGGWITLARPTDIVLFIIPLLWGVYNKETFIQKIKLIIHHYKQIIVFAIFAFLPFIPQFIYWKITTGHFLYYSYKNTEGFDFLHPHFLEVLFSFKKSLFVYTPLLILPLIGFFLLSEKHRDKKYSVVLFTLFNFFLLGSWAVWWCGPSFGMRYFVQSYAVLSIPLAVCVERIAKLKFSKYLILIPVLFFVFLNLFQTWQYVHWILPEDRMTYRYYKATFLKTNITEADRELAETSRNYGYSEEFTNENEYISHTLAYYNFDSINTGIIDTSKTSYKYFLSPPKSGLLNSNNPYCPTLKIPFATLHHDHVDHVWLRAIVHYYCEGDIHDNLAAIVFNSKHYKYNYKYRAFNLESYPFKKGEWNTIQVDYMSPSTYSSDDILEFYLWFRDKGEVYIDDVQLKVFEKKSQLN